MKRMRVFNKFAHSDRVIYIHETDEGHEFGLKTSTVLYDGYKAVKITRMLLLENRLRVFYGKLKKIDYPLNTGDEYSVFNIENFILTTLVVS